MKTIQQVVKVSVLAAMLSSVVMADVAMPLGNLSSGDNVKISSSAGSFAAKGDYAYLTGDVINTQDGATATLSLDNSGHVYISPNSQASVDKVDGGFKATLEKGSLGFTFTVGTKFSVHAVEQVIRVSSSEKASGAVAIGQDGKLVVRSYGAQLVITDQNGLITPVENGQTIALQQGQAELVDTAVQAAAFAGFGGMSAVASATLLVVGTAATFAVAADNNSKDNSVGEAPNTGTSDSGTTFVDANGVVQTGLDGGLPVTNASPSS